MAIQGVKDSQEPDPTEKKKSHGKELYFNIILDKIGSCWEILTNFYFISTVAREQRD